jgi:hypothetical protein
MVSSSWSNDMLKAAILSVVLAATVGFLSAAWSADPTSQPSGGASAGASGNHINLPPVPPKTIEAAIALPLIRFSRTMKGGAHTDGAWSGGGSIVLAVAAWQGNAAADKRLLEQTRFNLKGENSISANGGYPCQHERHVTGMYALMKMTPRVWNQLSADEQAKVDLVMKAALVASGFTTSDAVNGRGSKAVALDGDNNLNRGWNPNYQEGMIGEMIVGTVYFGGGAAAQKVLDTYDHDAFVAQLKAAGLTNTYETFTWKQAHPESEAPDGKAITAGIKNYRYLGHDLGDPMEIYYLLTKNTYGAKVNAGLNGGAGKDGAGMIASGADTLPNKGKDGMLLEFDSKDAGGPRSSITYAYDGFRPNLTNHVVLLAGGYWKPSAKADECLARMSAGITDLFYKLEHGYKDYSKGHASTSVFDIHQKGWSFPVSRSLWEDVIKPYHEAAAKAGK